MDRTRLRKPTTAQTQTLPASHRDREISSDNSVNVIYYSCRWTHFKQVNRTKAKGLFSTTKILWIIEN